MIFMGTATAIVYVDASNAYHGGAIAPGMEFRLTHSQITAHCFHRLI